MTGYNAVPPSCSHQADKHGELPADEPPADSATHREVQKLTAILDGLAAGITVADPVGRIVFCNRRAREVTGLSEGLTDLLGRMQGGAVFYANGEPIPADEVPVARLLRGETFEGEEHLIRRRDGSMRRIVASGSLISGESGPLAMVSFEDVTQLRDLERRREEYVQILSHDLRTPLQAITANAQMIMLRDADGPIRRHAQDILAAGRRIATMMDDLVLAASVEYKGMSLDRVPVDLPQLLRNLLKEFREVMDLSRIRLDTPGDCPTVAGDPRRLTRVFTNLIANAIHYSEPDSPVEITVCEGPDCDVLTCVADRGPGIQSDELPYLFTRSFRGRSGQARTKGMGLGLYIVRGLVDAHGGRVWVESVVGEGSKFYVSLPAAIESVAGEMH